MNLVSINATWTEKKSMNLKCCATYCSHGMFSRSDQKRDWTECFLGFHNGYIPRVPAQQWVHKGSGTVVFLSAVLHIQRLNHTIDFSKRQFAAAMLPRALKVLTTVKTQRFAFMIKVVQSRDKSHPFDINERTLEKISLAEIQDPDTTPVTPTVRNVNRHVMCLCIQLPQSFFETPYGLSSFHRAFICCVDKCHLMSKNRKKRHSWTRHGCLPVAVAFNCASAM